MKNFQKIGIEKLYEFLTNFLAIYCYVPEYDMAVHSIVNYFWDATLGMDDWYLYIVRCIDGSLYTGITTDVDRRLAKHEANKGSRYLRGRGPLKLVFKRRIGEKGRALKIECKIKGLSRQEKEELIKDTRRDAFTSLFMVEE